QMQARFIYSRERTKRQSNRQSDDTNKISRHDRHRVQRATLQSTRPARALSWLDVACDRPCGDALGSRSRALLFLHDAAALARTALSMRACASIDCVDGTIRHRLVRWLHRGVGGDRARLVGLARGRAAGRLLPGPLSHPRRKRPDSSPRLCCTQFTARTQTLLPAPRRTARLPAQVFVKRINAPRASACAQAKPTRSTQRSATTAKQTRS